MDEEKLENRRKNVMTCDELMQKIQISKKENSYYKNNPEMFDLLVHEVFRNLNSYGRRFRSKKLSDLSKWVDSQLLFLTNEKHVFDDYSATELAYLIFNDMHDFPSCSICKRKLDDPKNFENIFYGFLMTCSRTCGEKERQKSYERTCMRLYGVPHYAMNHERYEQRCDNMEKKYGVRNVFVLESTKKTIKQTKKRNHGDENYFNVEKQDRLDMTNIMVDGSLKKLFRRENSHLQIIMELTTT